VSGWRLEDVTRLQVAAGRRLLRIGSAGDDQIELIFERKEGEHEELLVTLPVWGKLSVGGIDLVEMERQFGRQYGLGVAV
jgi:hypothetical protein